MDHIQSFNPNTTERTFRQKPSVQHSTKDHDAAMLKKVPPQSLEAEESILSSILFDNSTLIDIMDILEPDHFYKDAHRLIFGAITDLFKKNDPTDIVTLTNALRDVNLLEKAGGPSYLTRLIETVPMAANVVHYAKIIREKAVLRRLISKASEIIVNCFEKQDNVEETVDLAERAIFEITQDKIKPSFYALKDVVQTSFRILDERSNRQSSITGLATGYKRLDDMTSGLQNSDLIILAARPSMGKTAFALNLARNVSVELNIPVAFFSLEMSKEQLTMRLLCSEARLDSSKVRNGFFEQEDWEQLTYAASVLSEAPIFIDDSPAISALELRAKSRRLKIEKGLGLVIIDYLQLMKVRTSAERRDLAIGEISSSLKALAKEINVPVIALSQLNRKLEERGDKRPILSDLRESGSLEQDADLVIFIYRDEVYNKEESNPYKGLAEILLRKQRNGPTGDITLKYNNTYTRFDNLAPEEIVEGY